MAVYFESKKNKRRMNQDYHLYMEYRVNHEAMIRTMLVADGMGGLSCGETASRLAGQTAAETGKAYERGGWVSGQ